MNKRVNSIPANVLKKLKAWNWPGNVRELENFIERSVILTTGDVLNVPLQELAGDTSGAGISEGSSERDQLIQVLKETKGRVGGPTGAAKRLGIKRTTLIARLKKYGINPRHMS